MLNIKQIENLVSSTSEKNIKLIINYLKGKKPSKISPLIMQDRCKLTSLQTDILKKICKQTDDGDLLSLTINAVTKIHAQNEDKIFQLVMSGDFIHKNVRQTHETIYQMIGRAKHKITIIGYWVFKMKDFFGRLEELENKPQITFILNDEKFEEFHKQIIKDWDYETRPEIYKLNRKKFPKKILNKLHSKIIIIDDKEILITSANLTIVAMEKNIETGIWTKDKKIINACTKIFHDFIAKRVFVPVEEKKY